ncbi:MAG: DUF2721 domain-containing protein [Promethearchaeota archaeon]
MTIITIISETLSPVVLISAVGLLNLMLQNRYGRIKDQVYRQLGVKKSDREYSEESKRVHELRLKRYAKESFILKNALLSNFLAITLFVCTCVGILANSYFFEDTNPLLDFIILLLFTTGLLILLVGVSFASYSLWFSTKTVSFEISQEAY